MRCWFTKGGDVLVEGPAEQIDAGYGPVVTPDGPPSVGAAKFYLLDAEGRMRTVFAGHGGSIDDCLFAYTHAVVDNTVHEYYCGWSGPDPPDTRDSVQIEGLVPVDPSAVPAVALLDQALAEYRAEVEAQRQSDRRGAAEQLQSFEEAIPNVPGDMPRTFAWRHERDPWAIAIRLQGGPVVWRTTGEPLWGKYLHPELVRILKRRYGDRFLSLDLDLPGESFLEFNPD
jgi:hypothetical protein